MEPINWFIMASCCVCDCCKESINAVTFSPCCLISFRAILNSSSLSLSGALRFEARFPFFDALVFSAGVCGTLGLDEVLFSPVVSLDSATTSGALSPLIPASATLLKVTRSRHPRILSTSSQQTDFLRFPPVWFQFQSFAFLYLSMMYFIFRIDLSAVLLDGSSSEIFSAIQAHVFLHSLLSN